MSYLFEKLHPLQIHVELSTSYYRGTFILKLFSSKVKSKFTPKVLCFIVLSKIDENRCKQTLASLP